MNTSYKKKQHYEVNFKIWDIVLSLLLPYIIKVEFLVVIVILKLLIYLDRSLDS